MPFSIFAFLAVIFDQLSSPDQLNCALLESEQINMDQNPSCSKRKSEEHTGNQCKKVILCDQSHEQIIEQKPSRISDEWSNETELFQTQFLKQIDKETAVAADVGNLSQYFNNSQMNFTMEPSISNTQQQKKLIKSLNLTTIFCDDEDTFDKPIAPRPLIEQNKFKIIATQMEQPQQSSQIFLKDLQQANIVVEPVIQLPNINDHTIYKSVITASAYIEKQRSMFVENEYNLNDDNYLDDDLSQAYKSSQYRRELEEIFDICEKTICKSADHDENNEFQENEQKDEPTEVIVSHNNTLQVIENVNWSQTFITPHKSNVPPKNPSLITPTAIVRQRMRNSRLSELTRQNSDLPVSNEQSFMANKCPAAYSSNTPSDFRRMGPFFGLPLKVKQLIKDFKGINVLYGKFVI